MAGSCELLPGGPVVGEIRPPGSKSLTNRALLCAAFASGPSHLHGALSSDDTEVMIGGLRCLGTTHTIAAGGQEIEVLPPANGCGRRSAAPRLEIFVGNSGTTIRFLAAALAALGGHYSLHGVPRMHQRPIGDLVAALTDLGAEVQCGSPGGCPPVELRSDGWTAGEVTVAGNVSSQFLSGLLMAAPLTRREMTIRVRGELVSRPYVDMTLAVMRSFGVTTEQLDRQTFRVSPAQGYRGVSYNVEPDASAASYPWAAAAISGGDVKVLGLNLRALQGDVQFVRLLEQMGCTIREDAEGLAVSGRAVRGIDADMNAISDCVQTLAVVALFASSPTRIRGVEHNRYKETDRIADFARELRKLGASVVEYPDGLEITPQPLHGARLETYHDHRMAMSLALAGLRVPAVTIDNPSCTAKTYPHYFADLERLLQRAHRWGD